MNGSGDGIQGISGFFLNTTSSFPRAKKDFFFLQQKANQMTVPICQPSRK